MRLISDEFHSGTIELLMTSPLTDTQLILGKWIGAMGFFLTLLVPTLVLVGVIEAFGDPDYGPLFTGYIGLILVGGFYLAIGTFASAISRNQIISYMLTVFTICLFTFVIFLLSRASFIPPKLQQAMQFMFVNGHFEDFGKGILDLSRVVYFVSATAFFLFLAVKLVESKRWR
jgi:ABC-2 type transport system permease protein